LITRDGAGRGQRRAQSMDQDPASQVVHGELQLEAVTACLPRLRAGHQHAGVVDQQIELRVVLGDVVREGAHGVERGEIGGDESRFSNPRLGDLIDQRLAALDIATMNDDVRAVRRKRTRQLAAEAIGGPGDQNRLAFVGQRLLCVRRTQQPECDREGNGKQERRSHGSISRGLRPEYSGKPSSDHTGAFGARDGGIRHSRSQGPNCPQVGKQALRRRHVRTEGGMK
jgi:hypothetical protein